MYGDDRVNKGLWAWTDDKAWAAKFARQQKNIEKQGDWGYEDR